MAYFDMNTIEFIKDENIRAVNNYEKFKINEIYKSENNVKYKTCKLQIYRYSQ
jgi:hypothetical protein